MGIRDILRNFFSNSIRSVQLQAEMREGIANQADLFNRRLQELVELQSSKSERNEQLLKEMIAGIANQTQVLNQRLKEIAELMK